MPEFYTFITEPISFPIAEIIDDLKEWGIEYFDVIDSERGKIISGFNWEEDCGYPVNLCIVFGSSGVRCIYCNNNEYGMIDGANDMQLFNKVHL